MNIGSSNTIWEIQLDSEPPHVIVISLSLWICCVVPPCVSVAWGTQHKGLRSFANQPLIHLFQIWGNFGWPPPTCMWTFLINTFWFSIGLFVLKKREGTETGHPGRVGIRSKAWHAAQWNHRYSLDLPSPLLPRHQHFPPPSDSHTLTHP